MNARTIAVLVTANTTSYKAQMAQASAVTKNFDRDLDRTGATLTKTSRVMKMAAVGAIAGFALALGAGVKQAVELDTAMRNVNSITGLSEQGLAKLSDQVVSLSTKLPQDANTLAEGLYDISSSGFQGAEALTVLEAAAVSASAGMTTTEVAARGIAAVLNAYGDSAEDAAHVSNVLFEGVNVGVITFEELSNTLGDFVGTASAAGIGIEDAVSAMATMTLTGINANESGTALNRTIQSIIKPSEALAGVFQQLGYESGAQALEVDGLETVIQRLRVASEGNIETLLNWFPEIRATRGALALMSDEGRTYTRVSQQMMKADEDGGAARRALNEQMKAWSARLTILKNNINAVAIDAGGAFLGWASRVLPYIQDIAGEIGDRLSPFVEDVGDSFDRLASIFGDVYNGAQPFLSVMSIIIGGAILTGINALGSGLNAVTGFLEDNRWAAEALGVALGALAAAKTWALIVSGWETMAIKAMYAAETIKKLGIMTHLSNIAGGARMVAANFSFVATQSTAMANASTAGMARMRAGMAGLIGSINPMYAAFAAAAAGVYLYVDAVKTADKQTKEMIEGATADVDPADLSSYSKALNELDTNAGKANDTLLQNSGAWGMIKTGAKGAIEIMTPMENSVLDASHAVGDLDEASQDYIRRMHEMESAYANIRRETGLTTPKIEELVKELELSEAEVKGPRALFLIRRHLQGLAEDAGFASYEVADAAGYTVDELVELKEELDSFVGEVTKSWAAATDSLQGLAGLEEINRGTITEWYDQTIEDTEAFADNIGKAFEMGYDAQLVSRLLQAGPAEAGEIVEQMASDTTGRLLWTMNAGEHALREINLRAQEMARLTHIAVSQASSDMASEVGVAMQISEINARTGGKATADAIAEELQIGVDRVTAIADVYGIALATSANAVLAAVGGDEIQYATASRYMGQGKAYYEKGTPGYNLGGRVAGPGSVDKDIIPAMLSPDEFVLRQKIARQWGYDFLEAVNDGKITPADIMAGGMGVGGYRAGGRVTGDLAGLNPILLQRLQAWAAARGQTYHVQSGYRSIEEQRRLYALYLSGRGNLAAVPGSSMHNFGLASDGNRWGNYGPAAFGLRYSVPGEPWHVEPIEAKKLRGGGAPSAHGMFFDPPPELPDFGDHVAGTVAKGVWGHARDQVVDWMSQQAFASPDLALDASIGANGPVREMVREMAAMRGWSGIQWQALDKLVARESSWNPGAQNPTSSAYGLFQFLDSTWRGYGPKTSDPRLQARYGMQYIADRYGTPLKALQFHNRNNWYREGGRVHVGKYDTGGFLPEGWSLAYNGTGAPEPVGHDLVPRDQALRASLARSMPSSGPTVQTQVYAPHIVFSPKINGTVDRKMIDEMRKMVVDTVKSSYSEYVGAMRRNERARA